MMKTTLLLLLLVVVCLVHHVTGLSIKNSRRAFLVKAATTTTTTAAAVFLHNNKAARATPEIFTTPSGVKYAVLQEGGSNRPQQGDIVAIDYTGYLTNGKIFDATHANGKSLLFKLGSDAVIAGLNDVVARMSVGQKVQAIVPPEMAFGDKGLCLEDGECLIQPGSTLVYDVYLKKATIPPP